MTGEGSIGYWSCKTSHSYSHLRNNNYEIFEEEFLEVSSDELRNGHRSQNNKSLVLLIDRLKMLSVHDVIEILVPITHLQKIITN